jgi:predicted nucleotidyltransferase
MSNSQKMDLSEILDRIKNDASARSELTKLLARDYPDEYLKHVKVDETKLKNVSAKFLASDKEWQE